MKLHSYLDAFFIQSKSINKEKKIPLEIGKIYKATILYSKDNFSYFKINDYIFKTKLIETSLNQILLRVLNNSENYKFELLHENVVLEKNNDLRKDLLSLLGEKFTEEKFNYLIKNSILNENTSDISSLINILLHSNYLYFESKYHNLFKLKDNQYFYIEFSENEPSCFSFSLNFEIEYKKIIIIKGYYKKKENKVICNFITNSKDFYKEFSDIESVEKDLTDTGKNFIWICNSSFKEDIIL
ncbi:MAG: hypothetical protein ACK4YF_03760 [Exilispira sp.]